MRKKIDIAKLIKRSILLIILLGIGAVFFLDRYAKSNGYEGISDFYSIYSSNTELSEQADPVLLKIDMSDQDYEFLESNRQKALDRGVQINIGDNYVPCDLVAGEESTTGEIRLKGHMTDHLQGDKWSFRVKAEDPIMGMYRFSLQHPATRNFIYEWVYHQLLAQEGIIHLNYNFIQLQLKDKDLGVYAMEEHFGQHVLEHNNRKPGAILRWNPGLYWEWRIDELQERYLDEQYSAYSSSYAEPYDKGVIRKDDELVENYQKGSALLEAFRRGDSAASSVFDVELMARFHAVIDLVGGEHSLDWSDIKFYYNPETGRVEPVGYESFSVRRTVSIAGQRIPNDYHKAQMNYHDQLFADPIFFEAYIRNLERIAEENYFNTFIQSIQEEFDQNSAIIALEWPHREFPFDPYFENIDLIRHNLDLPKAFHAFREPSKNDGSLQLSIAAVSDFPIEFIEIEVDGEKFEIKDFVLPAKARNTFTHYVPLNIEVGDVKQENMVIKARIPGSSNTFKVDVIEFPSYRTNPTDLDKVSSLKTLDVHQDAVYNESEGYWYFDRMQIVLDGNYVLEEDEIRILPGQTVNFKGGGLYVVNGKFVARGGKDQEIFLNGSSFSHALKLYDSEAEIMNTQITGSNQFCLIRGGRVILENCAVAGINEKLFNALDAEVVINRTQMGTVASLGTFDRSTLRMFESSCAFGSTFVHAQGSELKMVSCSVNGYDKVFQLDHVSIADMWSCELDQNSQIAALDNASQLFTYSTDLGEAEQGFVLDENSYSTHASSYDLYKSNSEGVKGLSEE